MSCSNEILCEGITRRSRLNKANGVGSTIEIKYYK